MVQRYLDFYDRNLLFTTLQENAHIVGSYFNLRIQSYFRTVMTRAFGVDSFWYRYEFAKSRGMIHWHGFCWRSDREPHVLLNDAISKQLDENETAVLL